MIYSAHNCVYLKSQTTIGAVAVSYGSNTAAGEINEIQVHPSESAVDLTGYNDLPYYLKRDLKSLGFREVKSHNRLVLLLPDLPEEITEDLSPAARAAKEKNNADRIKRRQNLYAEIESVIATYKK